MILFHDNVPWINKESNGDMGSCDGAEVCELAGLFMLSELSKNFVKN